MTATKLTLHGLITVDEQDADLLDKAYAYQNRRTCYAVNTQGKHVHRIIAARMVGRALTDKEQVDHANANGLDNRRENIRVATRSQNQANKPLTKTNKSGFKGVSWNKQNSKWRAVIKVNQSTKHLGYFIDPADAHRAYVEAAKRHFGEFANSGEKS